MERINILYIIDTLGKLAGAERNLYEITTRLNPQRFKSTVICLQGGKSAELLRDKGIDVINLKIKRIYTPLALIKALKIAGLIRKRNIKIVTYFFLLY